MTTLKETKKALFIEENGVQTWIPKSWIKKDGSLNKKATEKIQEELNNKDWNERTSEWTLQKSIDADDFRIVRESEKALFINFFDDDTEFNFWLPKSMKNEFWFVNKKMNEHDRSLILR